MGPHTELNFSQTRRVRPGYKTPGGRLTGDWKWEATCLIKDVNVLSLTGAGPSNDLASALYPSY